MQKVLVKGMSCQHCVKAVTSALEELGLTGVQVDLDGGVATFAPTGAVSAAQVAAAIDDAGFEVGEIS